MAGRKDGAPVGGSVLPQYERVRDLFARSTPHFGRGGAALAAYVEGEKVVDIWTGTSRPGQPWQEDTRAVVMSVSKGLTTICAQILYDRGQLDLEAPVATYWPEFAQNGKESVLVRHVLGHTSGVLGFDGQEEILKPSGHGWGDWEAISAGFAASAPSWVPGTRFGYHAFSYGWLVGELVSRIAGKNIGQFFQDEIAGPLKMESQIGTPAENQHLVARVIATTDAGVPRIMIPLMEALHSQMRSNTTLAGRAFIGGNNTSILDNVEEFMAAPDVLAAEIPAGNATSTARDLARLYAMMSLGGELDGVRIVSPESIKVFSRVSVHMPDALLSDLDLKAALRSIKGPAAPLVRGVASLAAQRMFKVKVRRGMGFMVNPGNKSLGASFGPNPNSFGHDGAGGQISFADPDNHLSVGYVRNHMATKDRASTPLIEEIYTCANIRTGR